MGKYLPDYHNLPSCKLSKNLGFLCKNNDIKMSSCSNDHHIFGEYVQKRAALFSDVTLIHKK